jgi:hypothetical protein
MDHTHAMPDRIVANPESIPPPRRGRNGTVRVPVIPRWVWVAAGLLVFGVMVAAGLMYMLLPPSTASFLIVAGMIVSMCGAGPVLLGAYSRQKAIKRRQSEDNRAEVIGPPSSSGDVSKQ